MAANSLGRIQPDRRRGGKLGDIADLGAGPQDRNRDNLNSYLLESTLKFRGGIMFSRGWSWSTRTSFFLNAPVHPTYRIGAYTFGGERDLIHDRAWQLGLGAMLRSIRNLLSWMQPMAAIQYRFRSFCECGLEAPATLTDIEKPPAKQDRCCPAGFRQNYSDGLPANARKYLLQCPGL